MSTELAHVLNVMAERFTSGNAVPVERAHIRRDEWDVVVTVLQLRDTGGTKSAAWHAALVAEIAAQKALIERMDYPPNRDMWNTGIMGQLRAERLELLEKLMAFEPLEFSERKADGQGNGGAN